MRMTSTRRLLAQLLYFVVAPLAIAACSEPNLPGDPPSGSMSFSYSGARTGSFQAEGSFPDLHGSRERVHEPYAASRPSNRPSGPVYNLSGHMPLSDTMSMQVVIVYPGTQPGRMAITSEAYSGVDFVHRDFPARGPRNWYPVIRGYVEVERIHEGRIYGTFEGVAVPYHPDALAASDTLYISRGRFDLPIVPVR